MPEQLTFQFTDGPKKDELWVRFPEQCRDRVVTLFTILATKAARGEPVADPSRRPSQEGRDEEVAS